MKQTKPRILVMDIETLPIEAYVWGLYDQTIPIEMVKRDFSIASFAAKFVGEKTVIYMDTSNKRDVRDDKELVKFIQRTMKEADVIVSQNGLNFDLPRINSRAWFHGLESINFKKAKKNVDLLLEGRRVFGHTSHKLAWITQKLAPTHQKSSHAKFPGVHLWLEVIKRNPEAWKEMKKYNIQDVIATEEVYKDYMTWFDHIDLRSSYMAFPSTECRACGSTNTVKNGTVRRKAGRFRTYLCNECGCTTTMSGARNNLDKYPLGYENRKKPGGTVK